MKRLFKSLITVFIVVAMLLANSQVPSGKAASTAAIDSAILASLAYLSNTQATDGSWGGGSSPVACTAMAVLAFENAPNSHYGWNASDPYHTTVQNGLNWLFSQAKAVSISGNNSAGNPDSNGNGLGIAWYMDDNSVYETPMVLMAIIASNAPTNVTTTGAPNVVGRTYYDIAVDIVDWIAWAQNSVRADGEYEGGWRYNPQQVSGYPDSAGSDNSVSQWPVLGLMAAQLWGINASAWVLSELLKWTTTDQNLNGTYLSNPVYGSFDYYPGRGLCTPAETAAGILELTYCGANETDPRILAAEGYLNKDWNPSGWSPNGVENSWNWNIGDLYDMYAVMKAARLTTPNATQFILSYNGTDGIDWYNGTGGYTDALIANQGPANGFPDGSWNYWVSVGDADEVDNSLGTAWGTLILEFVFIKVFWQLTVNVVDASSDTPILGAYVNVEGQQGNSYNGTTDSNGQVVLPALLAGSNTVNVSQAGYYSTSMPVDLTSNMAVNLTLKRIPTPTWQLTVNVVNASDNAPIQATFVDVEGLGTYNGTTDLEGQIIFPTVQAGKNIVSASKAGYLSNSTSVDLTSTMAVTLQLTLSPTPTSTSAPVLATIGIIMGVAIVASAICFLLLASADRLRRRRKSSAARKS